MGQNYNIMHIFIYLYGIFLWYWIYSKNCKNKLYFMFLYTYISNILYLWFVGHKHCRGAMCLDTLGHDSSLGLKERGKEDKTAAQRLPTTQQSPRIKVPTSRSVESKAWSSFCNSCGGKKKTAQSFLALCFTLCRT